MTRPHHRRAVLERGAALARVAAGRLAAAGVLVAAPLLLWSVAGNPLPAGVPEVEDLRRALAEGAVQERTIVKVLAAVCWAAWAQLVVAVAVELVAARRGRRPAVPVPRAFHLLAGLVITSAGVLASRPPVDGPAPAAPDLAGALAVVQQRAPDPPPLPPEAPAGDAAAPLPAPGTAPGPDAGSPPDAGHPPDAAAPGSERRAPLTAGEVDGETHVVARRETLWGIAQSRLGVRFRWPVLFELNRGRPQPDGSALEDPDHLHPGWTLRLPSDGEGAPSAAPGPAPSPDPSDPLRQAEAAERSSSIAEQEAREALDALRRAAEPTEPATTPTTAAGAAPGEPSERATRATTPTTAADAAPGEPTERATRATTPTTAAARREPAIPPAGPGAATGSHPPGAGSTGGPDRSEDLSLPHPETWPGAVTPTSADSAGALPVRPGSLTDHLGGAGILAAGAAWTIARRRTLRERRRRPGTPVRLADPDARRAERGLRGAADHGSLERLDAALRAFAVRLRRAGRTPPPVVGVNVAEEISVLLGEAAPDPVDGFTVEDDGFSWVLAPPNDAAALRAEAAGGQAPYPALVTVGSTGASQVLLNLEHLRLVAVSGAGLHVQETLFCAAVELATGPWAGALEVRLVGFGQELAPLPGVSVHASVAEAVEPLEDGGPRRRPAIVLCAGAAPGPELDRLEALTEPGAGSVCAVVAGPDLDAPWRLEVTGEDAHLLPVDVWLHRHRITARDRAAVAALVAAEDAAGDPPEERHEHRPTAGATAPSPGGKPSGQRAPDEEPAVEVRVLGAVEVSSAAFERRKALELVAYLATHAQGVDADALAEALWPDRIASSATLHSTLSLARRSLGAGSDGTPRIPHLGPDGRYRLADDVTCDLDRFAALVARSREEPERAEAHLRRALALVRGRPFTVPGGEYLWAHAEALASAAVAEVVSTADELAALYLDAGNIRGAWWATRQGLLASPANEALHRDRMLAADRTGDPEAVQRVMEELCRAVEVDAHEAPEVLHPMTLELFERLRRGVPAS